MDPAGILLLLVFIFIGIGRAIAYVIKNAPANDGRKRAPRQGPGYVAPQNAVRDFLRNLQQAHQTADPDIVVLPTMSAREAGVAEDPDFAPLSNEESTHDEECHDPLPSETRPAPVRVAPVRLSRTSVQADRPRRRRKPRKPAERSRRVSASAPVAEPVQRKTPRPAMRGSDLRQAVIWSEILGPPVSLRPRGERGYGAQRR
jgi:hypothetical protein